MRRLIGVYRAKFRAEIASQFAYRGALVIWLLGLVIEPIVSLVVWTTVAETQGGSVGGFTAATFAAYFVAVMIVNQLTFTWHFWEFDWRVRNGFFSPHLLRPIHPIHNDIAENVTFKLLTFVVVAPVAVFLVISFRASFAAQPWQLVAFVPALALAMTLRFLVEWTFATAAFWITRTGALNQAYNVVILFLSGMLAPLSLLPPPIEVAASILPFRWMISFPVEVVLGRAGPADVAAGLAAQVIWIVVAVAILRVVWAAGTRRYSAVGA